MQRKLSVLERCPSYGSPNVRRILNFNLRNWYKPGLASRLSSNLPVKILEAEDFSINPIFRLKEIFNENVPLVRRKVPV